MRSLSKLQSMEDEWAEHDGWVAYMNSYVEIRDARPRGLEVAWEASKWNVLVRFMSEDDDGK